MLDHQESLKYKKEDFMKKLITFLGNGDYTDCVYTGKNNFVSRPTEYVQTALFEQLQFEEEAIDKIYLFVTKEAKESNYFESRTREGEYKEGLKRVWEKYFPEYVDKLVPVDITSGQSEADQWELFETIFSVIDEEDELYFDITHSFRSIPFITLLITNFAKVIKNASIKRLFYGNFEELFHLDDFQSIPVEQRKAPIVDITSMVNLLDWSISVESFIRTGNPRQIDALAEDKIKESRGNTDLIAIRKLTNELVKFNKMMETSRGKSFYSTLPNIQSHFENVSEVSESSLPQFSKLMSKIEEKMGVFSSNKRENMWGAIKWCADHGLLQQAYTLAREYIISSVIKDLDLKGALPEIHTQEDSRKLREKTSYIILTLLNPNERLQIDDDSKYVSMVDPIKEMIERNENAFKAYPRIVSIRNNMNHTEKGQEKLAYMRIETYAEVFLEQIKPIFYES